MIFDGLLLENERKQVCHRREHQHWVNNFITLLVNIRLLGYVF